MYVWPICVELFKLFRAWNWRSLWIHLAVLQLCYSSVTQSGSVTQAGNLFDPYLGDPMVADQHLVDPGYPEHFTPPFSTLGWNLEWNCGEILPSLQLAVQEGSFAQPSSVFLLATASLPVLAVFYPSSPSRTTYLNRFQIAEPRLTLHVQFTQFPSWSTVLLPHSTCVTPGNSVKDLLVQAFLRCLTIFLTRCSPYLLFLSFFKTGFAGF